MTDRHCFITLAALSGSMAPSPAIVIVETYATGAPSLPIPDGNPSVQTISRSSITPIQSVTLDLTVSGSFDGDAAGESDDALPAWAISEAAPPTSSASGASREKERRAVGVFSS